MTVKELIEKLKKLDQNLEVIMAQYELPHGPWSFVHVDTVKKDAVSIGPKDKYFAHIYGGNWLDQKR